MDYIAYIKSKEWRNKRERALELGNYRCRLCGDTESLEVHHTPSSYSHLGKEEDWELTVVCKICHDLITDRIRSRRYGAVVIETAEHKSILPDTERTLENERASIEVEIYKRSTPIVTQRANSRPDELLLETHQGYLFKANKG